MQNGKTLHSAGLRTGAAPDWSRLVPGRKDEVLGALREWLGARRDPDPEVEHGYWKILLDRCTAIELADAVLERLVLDEERLLDVGSESLLSLRERLESVARERLAQLSLSEEDRHRIDRHLFLLGEVAFEGQGHLPLAAAFYAVIHEGGTVNAFSRYEAILLRFKLGNALLLLDERIESRQRCVGMVRQACRRAEELRCLEESPRDALRALTLEIHIWLGHRQEEMGELEAAAEAFLAAIGCAVTPDDRVTCTARAASVLAACGRTQEARERLLSVSEEVENVEDGMVRALWEAVLWSLGHG